MSQGEYKIDYEHAKYNIVITKNNNPIINIPINSLLLNNGNNPTDNPAGAIAFEKSQQEVNYLDSIKDGTNVTMLNQLNIYPEVNYLPFNNLEIFEDKITEVRKSYLERTTWLKVKKGSLLNKGKYYNQCLWESGLGYETFFNNPSNVNTIKTFGSFIDPLEKNNANEVWPPKNSSIKLTENFMKLMGFDKSSITAKTINNNEFEYIMNIKCGDACKQNSCYLTDKGDDEKKSSDFYFQGNNQKKQVINKSSSFGAKNKVKFIVTKEWGDKLQVIIYLMYYHTINNIKNNVTMVTCDKVVFMLCLNFGISCIYTGQYNPPGFFIDANTGLKFHANEKNYSILEYKPSDNPYEDALRRLSSKIKEISDENDSFINNCLRRLAENADTTILGGGSNFKFSDIFYKALITDILEIQQKFKDKSDEILKKYSNLKTTKESVKKYINEIESDIKMLESNFIIVPFIKIKKGTKNTPIILTSKSYTLQKPANNVKPSIAKIFMEREYSETESYDESKKGFLELATKYFQYAENNQNNQYDKSNYIKKGGGLSNTDIELFPADEEYDEKSGLYDYITNEKKENNTNEKKENNTHIYDKENSEVVNPNTSREPIKFNLLNELNTSFNQAFEEFTQFIKQKVSNDLLDIMDNFKDTIYTLFVYESYIEGYATINFTVNDIHRIIKRYDLDFKDLLPNKSKSIKQGISLTKRKLIESFSKSKKNKFTKNKFTKNQSIKNQLLNTWMGKNIREFTRKNSQRRAQEFSKKRQIPNSIRTISI
jgi:hypothetical protein